MSWMSEVSLPYDKEIISSLYYSKYTICYYLVYLPNSETIWGRHTQFGEKKGNLWNAFAFQSIPDWKLLQRCIHLSYALKRWNRWYEMYHVYGLLCKTYISKVRPRRSKNEGKRSFSNHPPQPPTRNGFHCCRWLFDDLYLTRWMCYYYQ